MGIQRKVRASGKVLYYARLWSGTTEHVEGGFTTHTAAEKALAMMRKRLEAKKIGEPEVHVPGNPTIAELLGDPDADDPGAGTYLAWMTRPGGKVAPLYLRRLKTAIRALLPFWGPRHVVEVNADTIVEYQTRRLSEPLRVGEKIREEAAARRKAAGIEAPRKPKAEEAKGTTVGPACVNREVMALRGALTWAADPTRDPKRRIAPVPWPKGIALEEPDPRNEVIKPDDEVRLIREAKPEWLRDLVILMRATGIRPGEGLGLRWAAVNLDDGYLVIVRSKSKTKVGRGVPIGEDALAMLRRRKEEQVKVRAEAAKKGKPWPDDDLIFTTDTGRGITSTKASSVFGTLAHKLKLKTEGEGRPTLHSIRHTVASRVIRQGFSESEVAALLGHSKTSDVTDRYLHTNMERLRSMVEAAAPGQKPKLRVVRRRDGEADTEVG